MRNPSEIGYSHKYERRAKMAAVMSGLGLVGGVLESGIIAPSASASAKVEAATVRSTMPEQAYLNRVQAKLKKLTKEMRTDPNARFKQLAPNVELCSVEAPDAKNPSHHDELAMIFTKNELDFPSSTVVIVDVEANPQNADPVKMKSGETFNLSTANPTTLKNDPNFATLINYWPGGFGGFAVSNGADAFSKKLSGESDNPHRLRYSTHPTEVSRHFQSFFENAQRILKESR